MPAKIGVPGDQGRLSGGRDGRRADSIDNMDLLRPSAMTDLFGGVGASSTLGSFLPSFTLGNAGPVGKGQPGALTGWLPKKTE